MSMHYLDHKRESDPHALPNVETFYLSSRDILSDEWRDWARDMLTDLCALPSDLVGWYWWACFPGCLPDSDPVGPFASEADALEDASEGMDDDDTETETEGI